MGKIADRVWAMGMTSGTAQARSERAMNSIELIACRPQMPPAVATRLMTLPVR